MVNCLVICIDKMLFGYDGGGRQFNWISVVKKGHLPVDRIDNTCKGKRNKLRTDQVISTKKGFVTFENQE